MGRILKIDITENVTAKFKQDYLEIYTNKYLIGKYYVYTDDIHVDLMDGYIHENGRFYKIVETLQDRAYIEK
ncbi:MAG: DUF2553 family protein [Bacillaceae bacterium]